MKILVLIGSGHNNSRCEKIVPKISEIFNNNIIETEVICNLNLHECLGCEYCLEHQDECILKDDMIQLYQKLKDCDILVFISPCYFSNIPATLKKVIDRCQLFFNLKNKDCIKPKKFFSILIGGAPAYKDHFKAFELTYRVLLPNLKADNMGTFTQVDSDKIDFLSDNKFNNRLEEFLKQKKEECNA